MKWQQDRRVSINSRLALTNLCARLMALLVQHCLNRFFTEAKLDLMKIIGKELPLTERQSMMKKIKAKLMAWSLDQTKTNAGFTTTFSIPAWLPEPFRMVKNYTMTLNMQTIERIPLPPIN